MEATGDTVEFGDRRQRGGRLPAEVTSFVGRQAELALIQRAFRSSRLVTLVGPGGVGKSRTALKAVGALQERFCDGVWLVELSALQDPELIPATLAAALDLPEQSGMTPLDAVIAHLRERRLLIVLDTCEHLVDGCAALCGALLHGAPDVGVLATSRQPLDVPGEHCVPIAGMAPADALELFVQRASSAVGGFAVTQANRGQLTALVARFDYIPLALKLAAVRLRAMSLAELVARLDCRFDVITGGLRCVPARHQSLRATIDWSYDLCTPPERLLWARLSVFAGSFELATAEHVCAGGDPAEDPAGDPDEGPDDDLADDLADERLLETLVGLTDKSVVQRLGDGSGRYRLLDTIREYGADRLQHSGDTEALSDRHFEHYRALAARFWAELLTDSQVRLFEAVRTEIADVRAALTYAYATEGRAVQGLWLATQLGPYWRAAGTLSQGAYWIDKGLALVTAECAERAWGLFMTGLFAVWTADLPTAVERFQEALEVARRAGDERVAMFAEAYLAALTALGGAVGEGLAALERAHRRIAEAGDALGMSVFHYEGALLRAVLGDTAGALDLCRAGLERLEGTGERQFYGSTLTVQGIILWLAGQHEQSAEPLHRGLEAAVEIGEALVAALACLGLGWHAAQQKRYVRACWLLGYAEHTRRLSGDPVAMLPSLLEEQESVRQAVRAALGEEQFERWHRTGARLSGRQVLAAVRADTDAPIEPAAPADSKAPMSSNSPWAGALTPREREVAALVAQGLSNREVAERLVMSTRTADTHVVRILAKLRISSRTEIRAALAPSPWRDD